MMMVGAPLNVLAAVCGGYFSGMGKTRITGVAAAAGNAANILLDWLFIFGKCGLPEGGIAGAAWASNLATLVTCAVYAFAISRDKTFRACGPLGGVFAFDWPLVKRIVRFGAPSGFQVALDCFTFTVFVMMTGRLDAMSLAVSNVVFTVNHLSFAPLMGMNQAASVLAGNYMGAKDTASATRAGASCLVVGWLYFALFALFVALCGERMIDAFHGGEASAFDPAQFRALGMALMWILVSWGFFDATDLVLSGALKGAGDTRFVMCAFAIVSFCMWMPAFLAVMKITPGIIPLWLTMPAYCAVCATIITTRWMRGKWKMLKLI
ncbi:MAG: polysaccharide biosynthesis C-terminal domain-containing protein [Kiritimatiellae bacterium]|nr:polysaccharide biosynthesis C-terminal domain-containing protein [Kiritimatiellia bacterium]